MNYKQIFVLGMMCTTNLVGYAQILKPIDFTDIKIEGELNIRANKNLDRLQSDRYAPDQVYPARAVNTEGWPGDYEGRVLMGLILDAQATHQEPKYLAGLLKALPGRLNKNGYFGPIQGATIQEQQLSGNSWLLRTLCEYYHWKKDPEMKSYISKVISNLVLPTKGYHAIYPIDPAQRKKNVGEVIGSEGATIGKWIVSTDIGTDFVFLDGVVQAYEICPSPELKIVIDEMINRYLQLDLRGIKAQAHAALTGLRGLLRYYAITGQPNLLEDARKRYDLYRTTSMTANFENFNWFDRPEWTEPCAIVDSYLIAVQLWQFTNAPLYLEDAHHIYFNGIANTQRANGGFGLSTCPRPDSTLLKVYNDEAWWCCTMRGAEGLSRAVQYNYFAGNNEVVIPFYNSSRATIRLNDQSFVIKEISSYPFQGKVSFEILGSSLSLPITLKLFAASWTKNHKITINGMPTSFVISDGFIVLRYKFVKGDKISLTFDQVTKPNHMVNTTYSRPDFYTLNYGPLILGYNNQSDKPEISFTKPPELTRIGEQDWNVKGTDINLSTVYHLLDPKVTKESGYAKQILFRIKGR